MRPLGIEPNVISRPTATAVVHVAIVFTVAETWRTMSRIRTSVAVGLAAATFFVVRAPVARQWLNQPTKGIPRTADGSFGSGAACPGGIEGAVGARYLINILRDVKGQDVPFQP